ncbi:P protein-like isoform X1 [Diabrotica virgifera virgifera]|uniref:Citrate transporter-like domain-containing protein n=1 Tax=Diabrotica virgifera virgifera TaxID=50390 RepID=A0ABM5JUX1_DIAVI|nr:P protein-like isoform X1 [Diabrotica virgifera virgifera]
MEKESSLSRTVFKSIEVANTSKVKVLLPLPQTTKWYGSVANYAETEDNDDHKSVFFRSSELLSTVKTDIRTYLNVLKICILVVAWILCSYALTSSPEKDKESFRLNIPEHEAYSFILREHPKDNTIKVMLKGRILPPYYANLTSLHMKVWVQIMVVKHVPTSIEKTNNSDAIVLRNISEVWRLPLASHEFIKQIPKMEYTQVFHVMPYQLKNFTYYVLRLQFATNLRSNLKVSMKYNLQPTNPKDGILYAALILAGLYFMIIFDIIHRTMASVLASTVSIATLAALDQRPSIAELVSWIDMETLILLFSMMTMVSIFSETGVFDYTAVLAFNKTGGKLWPLINVLCILAAVSSCFLDTVTTALLITPITIRICEVIKVNPIQILIYTLIFANIGGAITPIGDPPNVIIASNPDVMKAGITFGVFTLHTGIGACIILFIIYLQIRIMYRDIKHYQYDEPEEIKDLKREIAVWERTAASVSSYSKDENIVKESLLKQMAQLQNKLKDTVNQCKTASTHVIRVENLKKQYPIKNKSLLIKSGITLALVICLFFFNSIPAFRTLGLGWTALLGVILLLILYDSKDLDAIFARVEWSTLLFFASLFILMEALSRLGLIDYIGKQTQYVITSVGPDSRLATAIVLILWVSAVASAFVDNLPLTTMMIRIAIDLSHNEELHLPLPPLIWALSFGSCLGGNGSLFGSSSNIICAGVAEQHGYRFSFLHFTKVGLPVMITSTIIITMYLLVCHVILGWQ